MRVPFVDSEGKPTTTVLHKGETLRSKITMLLHPDGTVTGSARGEVVVNQEPILQYCRECGWQGVRWEAPTYHGANPTPGSNLWDCPRCGEDLEPLEDSSVAPPH